MFWIRTLTSHHLLTEHLSENSASEVKLLPTNSTASHHLEHPNP